MKLTKNIRLTTKAAGLICFYTDGTKETPPYWSFHFLVRPSFWLWGREDDWYDGPIVSWGLGPLFLFNKTGE